MIESLFTHCHNILWNWPLKCVIRDCDLESLMKHNTSESCGFSQWICVFTKKIKMLHTLIVHRGKGTTKCLLYIRCVRVLWLRCVSFLTESITNLILDMFTSGYLHLNNRRIMHALIRFILFYRTNSRISNSMSFFFRLINELSRYKR